MELIEALKVGSPFVIRIVAMEKASEEELFCGLVVFARGIIPEVYFRCTAILEQLGILSVLAIMVRLPQVSLPHARVATIR